MVVDVHENRDGNTYYHLGMFRTPRDVMEFFIKHNTKKVYPYYDKGYKIDINMEKKK